MRKVEVDYCTKAEKRQLDEYCAAKYNKLKDFESFEHSFYMYKEETKR